SRERDGELVVHERRVVVVIAEDVQSAEYSERPDGVSADQWRAFLQERDKCWDRASISGGAERDRDIPEQDFARNSSHRCSFDELPDLIRAFRRELDEIRQRVLAGARREERSGIRARARVERAYLLADIAAVDPCSHRRA